MISERSGHIFEAFPSGSGSESDSASLWTSSAFFKAVSNFLTKVLGKSLLFSHVLSESGYPYKIDLKNNLPNLDHCGQLSGQPRQ